MIHYSEAINHYPGFNLIQSFQKLISLNENARSLPIEFYILSTKPSQLLILVSIRINIKQLQSLISLNLYLQFILSGLKYTNVLRLSGQLVEQSVREYAQ